MLLGDAVMLFHRKMRHYKKYRALTDTDRFVALFSLFKHGPCVSIRIYPSKMLLE